MQQILDALGFPPGRTDGYFSTQTVTAVKNFQLANHIPVTGQLDKKTADYLAIAYKSLLSDPKNDKQLQATIQFMVKNRE
jgi:carboxyl-terminal processing protease